MTVYCFDLDGTLCTNTYGEYNKATPFTDKIEMLNKLYDDGHHIIIETARGSASKIDWLSLTTNQINVWGIKHHQLRVGHKIQADVYVDDKAINVKDFF